MLDSQSSPGGRWKREGSRTASPFPRHLRDHDSQGKEMSAMISLFIALLILLSGAFIMTQSKGSRFGFALVIIGTMFLLKPALGHDHSRPELNGWLKSLFSQSKVWCCDGNDTDAIEDWDTHGKNYRVKFRGQWYDVPESAIVDGPNKSGGPLLWMDKGYSGFKPRCFMPGSMT